IRLSRDFGGLAIFDFFNNIPSSTDIVSLVGDVRKVAIAGHWPSALYCPFLAKVLNEKANRYSE
ncbi:MAG: hypothetical protein WB052_17095, partial [Pseudolabrys sp.]